MAVRILMLAGAVVLIVVGVTRTHARSGCDADRHQAFQVGAGQRAKGEAGALGERLVRDCRSAVPLINASAAFLHAGALEASRRLASTAARREPERRDAWIAVANTRRFGGDASGADRALARARQLDPLSFRR